MSTTRRSFIGYSFFFSTTLMFSWEQYIARFWKLAIQRPFFLEKLLCSQALKLLIDCLCRFFYVTISSLAFKTYPLCPIFSSLFALVKVWYLIFLYENKYCYYRYVCRRMTIEYLINNILFNSYLKMFTFAHLYFLYNAQRGTQAIVVLNEVSFCCM